MKRRRKRRSKIKKLFVLLLVFAILVPSLILAIEPIERKFYPLPYSEIVVDVAEKYNLAPSLIFAVIYAESKFDPQAVSSADALGLMQITESTYQWACNRTNQKIQDTEVLLDPETNIRFGTLILSLLLEQFDNLETALAAYNAGQGTVNTWLKDPAYSDDGKTLSSIPYEETTNYVRRVIDTQKKYQKLYNIP